MIAMVRMKVRAYAGHQRKTNTHITRKVRGVMMATSDSSVRVHEQDIVVTKPVFGQSVAGWITSTQTDTDGQIFYGFFSTKEEAMEWGTKLINAVVEPVYHPAYNAG
jgi:hypothetical protein